jgi:tetratricopeptide (TPR) repeat protein
MRGWKTRKKEHRFAPAERRRVFWIGVALIAANLIVYAPLRHYGFVNYGDPQYVLQNPIVTQGLTWRGMLWALRSANGGMWFPLTWTSHMLDIQMYGPDPGGHHLTNIVLHIANTLLLFLVLCRLTRAIGPSAFVAAVFSLHPLQVESVAWVADRQNLLGTLFWMLTLVAYARYASRPRVGRYLLVVLLYALELTATPTLVMLPFVLLLLDFWPLRRVPHDAIGESAADAPAMPPAKDRAAVVRDLLWEKVPMFALAMTSALITIGAQRRAAISLDAISLPLRMANAVVSYVAYTGKFLWPARLAVFYSYPGSLVALKAAGAILVLSAISLVVFRQRRARPYLAVGWFWFLVTLVPVIGFVQIGNEAMADRYSYLPLVGLGIAVAWLGGDLVTRGRLPRRALGAAAAVVIVACALIARRQVVYWENSLVLWQHAHDVNAINHTVETNLARAYADEGKVDDAIAHFTEAVRLTPDAPELHYALATVLGRRGKLAEAATHYSEALRIRPNYAEAHTSLGSLLLKQGKTDQAIDEYSEALRIKPDPVGHYTVAMMLRKQGRAGESDEHLKAALRLQPNFPAARVALLGLATTPKKAASKPAGDRP